MRTNPHKYGDPNGDILNGDARAVIEAEFEEITARKPPHTLAQAMKDLFQWIKQRLNRASWRHLN